MTTFLKMNQIIHPLKLQFFQSLTCNSFIFASITNNIIIKEERL